MRYMLLIYTNEKETHTPEQTQEIVAAHWRVMDLARERGFLESAEPLFPTQTATTVRFQNGKPLITDGPFAETKEQLAGYYILNCDNLDQVLDLARMVPTACGGGAGCVEIRPIRGLPARTQADPATNTVHV